MVEDEPGLAEVLAVHLQAGGYHPIVVHDGLEALYALERVTPHAVLLDLHLPQVSGFRLIKLLKQRPDMPRVPVIVLTALSFQEAEDAVRAGADDFLTKPFLPAEVVTPGRPPASSASASSATGGAGAPASAPEGAHQGRAGSL